MLNNASKYAVHITINFMRTFITATYWVAHEKEKQFGFNTNSGILLKN